MSEKLQPKNLGETPKGVVAYLREQNNFFYHNKKMKLDVGDDSVIRLKKKQSAQKFFLMKI